MGSKVAEHRHRNTTAIARLMHTATSSYSSNLFSLLTKLTTTSTGIKLASTTAQPQTAPPVGPLCNPDNPPSTTICMPLLLPDLALSVTNSHSASSSPHQASPSGSPLASDSSIKSVSSSSGSRSPGFPSTVGISGLSSSSKGGGPAFVGQVFSMCDLTGTGLLAVSTHIEIPFLSKRMRRLKEVYRVINFSKSLHSSPKWVCSTQDIVLCPDVNDGVRVGNLSTPIYSVIVKSSSCLEELCCIVSSGIGSLDDLELSLDRLGASIITSTLVTEVIDCCKYQAPTRRLLRFLLWSRKNLKHKLGDNALNHAIRVFAERKDLTALDILIANLQKEQGAMETETFGVVAEAFVKLGREDKALGLFKNLEKFKCLRDRISVSSIVHALCAKGHARKAEGVVWHHKSEIFGVEVCIYKSLLHGWFVNGNVKETRRIIDEMKSLGVPIDLFCYNTYLRCLCKRNLKFNPSALVTDAFDLIVEMKSNGIAPNVVSFNTLLSCLGKTRRVKEAYRVLYSMKNSGCSPDCVSYYLVARVLYLSGRFGMGNRIVDEMIEEGLVLEPRLYHDLIGVLCGVERVNHALNLFEKMKKTCVGDFSVTYDLLILKLCKDGDFEKGKQLWDEAARRGITLQCSKNVLDPSITEVFKPTKEVEVGST